MRTIVVLVAAVAMLGQPQGAKPEATSLLGKPLYAPVLGADARRQLEANLARAEAVYGSNPDDPDATIWLGRRLAYLGRYREAIEHFSDGIEKHPDDARMYRHRGHRYITVRDFARAIADLAKAAQLVAGKPDEVEPDGQPNARNIPTSTLQSNIYYHLALAQYLSGDFEAAAGSYRLCLGVSKNPDMLVATTYWYYLTLKRLGRTSQAAALLEPITSAMEIIENGAYHSLLLSYKAASEPPLPPGDGAGLDAVTRGYGRAAWHLANGQPEKALPILQQVVDLHAGQWAAFGYIASEADLARLTARAEGKRDLGTNR